MLCLMVEVQEGRQSVLTMQTLHSGYVNFALAKSVVIKGPKEACRRTTLRFRDFDAYFMVEVLSFLQIGWLNAIREWQEEFVGNMSSREFVETITRDLLGSRVFVFTPRGEVRLRINLHL